MKIKQLLIIENARDERAFEWLIKTVGEEKILWAIANLHQNKKPYLTNIIKILGLTVPGSVLCTPVGAARENLNQILAFLDKKI